MKKRGWIAGLVGLLMLITAGCGTQSLSPGSASPAGGAPSDGPKQKVVLTQATHGFLYTPVYIAKNKGYFAEEGLDVEVVVAGGGPKAMAALFGGSAQVTAGGVENVFEANKQGQSVQMFASLMNEIASNVVMHKDVAAKLGITEKSTVSEKIRALKGLKIGVTTPGSSTDTLMRKLLEMENMNPNKDVQLMPLGKSEAMIPAFRNKQIDVFAISSPTSDLATIDGTGIMLLNMSKGEVKPLQGALYQGLIAKKDELEKNKPLYEKLTRAVAKAEAFLKTDKNGAKETLKSSFPDIEAAIFDTAFENNYHAFPKDPYISKEAFEIISKFQGVELTYEQVVNTSLTKK